MQRKKNDLVQQIEDLNTKNPTGEGDTKATKDLIETKKKRRKDNSPSA